MREIVTIFKTIGVLSIVLLNSARGSNTAATDSFQLSGPTPHKRTEVEFDWRKVGVLGFIHLKLIMTRHIA